MNNYGPGIDTGWTTNIGSDVVFMHRVNDPRFAARGEPVFSGSNDETRHRGS